MNIDQRTSKYEVNKLRVRPKTIHIDIRTFAAFFFEVYSVSNFKLIRKFS